MRKGWSFTWSACLVIVFATWAFAATAWAQAPTTSPNDAGAEASKTPREELAEKRLERMSEQLNLTEEQKGKILPLLQSEQEHLKAVRSNASLTQGEARRRMQRIRRNTNQQISQILTPEQRQQWRQDRPAAGGRRGGGPGGAPQAPSNPPNQP
jgi:Spy/CpxP family protein refolding chaperone